jgi:putative DNA primase/helicase
MGEVVTPRTLADAAWNDRSARFAEATPEGWFAEQVTRAFAARYGSTWRYVEAWGCWLHWDGRRWKREKTQLVVHLIRETVAELLKRTPQRVPGNVVAIAERYAQTTREVARDETLWDADPWLLNCPNGTVDLRTGALRPHSPHDHLTKVAHATPGGGCPLWKEFLFAVTGGDSEVQAYLQRTVGYWLTGITSEQVFFFAYGTGANGKSVFVNTLLTILGDYARSAPTETFMMTRMERHPTELAGLRGYRMVAAVELSRGARWNESRLKMLTGGERVTARFMRQDEFEYQPQLKLLIVGNHRPSLRSVDEAMRRRLHLLPFEVTIPKEDRDPDLTVKLLAERDGILAWALQGCLDWQREGLNPPPPVRAATEAYFSSQDTLGRWLDECCQQGPNMRAASGELFDAWKQWCEANGEFVGPRNDFSQALSDRGFKAVRGGTTGRGFMGLALRDRFLETVQ